VGEHRSDQRANREVLEAAIDFGRANHHEQRAGAYDQRQQEEQAAIGA
jgi:hypothetical protein